MTLYEQNVISRSKMRYLKGLLIRYKQYLYYRKRIIGFRKKGGAIGDAVCLPKGYKRFANENINIGEHCSIQTVDIDTRSKIKIGDYVIIGQGVKILTNSHNIDSTEFELKKYGVEIADYVWIATNATILPSCRKIGKGAVIGAGAVVTMNVPDMAVVAGNPATIIKYRENVHSDLVVESLLGGDYLTYKNVGKKEE